MGGWIFLSGMMGTGKSTVAATLASRRGAAAIDLDARVEARAGATIPDIFARDGEAGFRALEASELEEVLDGGTGGVVALGGGTVTRLETRRRLLEVGTLVTLTAPVTELVRRVRGSSRPLLAAADPAAVLRSLLEARRDAYAECHAIVDTDGRSPEEIARDVEAVARRRPVAVPLGARTYRVEIGAGVRRRVERLAKARLPGEVVILVTDDHVRRPWGEDVEARLQDQGKRVLSVVLPPGEEHKTLSSVERIWDAALRGGVDRSGAVVTVGGGVVGDLGGFAAATVMRGIRVAQVPTSLLAMVDASVGGKTGFDRPEGKNLVGAFHQPEGVMCDVETLSTLPDEELVAGLAEVVKAAWLDSDEAVAALERDAGSLLARDGEALQRAIRMAVTLKARVVAADEREGGVRRTLNLGHTVGHAIEAARGYAGIRHGEAVALGMVAAFRVAEALGDAAARAHGARLTELLRRLGLPTDLDAHLDERTASFLRTDKKRSGDGVAFIVPGPPGAVRVERLPFERIRAAVPLP